MTSGRRGPAQSGDRPISRRAGGEATGHAIEAHALKALIDAAEVDCGLVIKLILIAQHADSRPILDALTMANLSRMGEVREEICARLEAISAEHREAAE